MPFDEPVSLPYVHAASQIPLQIETSNDIIDIHVLSFSSKANLTLPFVFHIIEIFLPAILR